MSTTNQTAGPSRSNHNFAAIFQVALSEYENVTGQPLHTHPFATQLDSCDSPRAISNALRSQAQAFSKFGKGDEKLVAYLGPTVHILSTFSATLGEGIGLPFSPAKTIFTGIGVLLAAAKDDVEDHNKPIHLFERIHFFLQRLSSYTRTALTGVLTELLGKIMAQILSILALSTKAMTEGRIKKYMKKLIGRTKVEDALLRLDSLTKEESLIAVAKDLEVKHQVKILAEDAERLLLLNGAIRWYALTGKQIQERLQRWLSPPECSINHNNACKTQHDGTGTWFIHCNKFREWKKDGSLLWISGNPGAGKSVLCSAIIEDIKKLQEEGSAWVTYHYFDFKDASKRHVRGLLASLLFQLSGYSDHCRDVLYRPYNASRGVSEQPDVPALVKCLKMMVRLLGRLPIFVIMDALDECPNTTGTPSARDEVLDLVGDLLELRHPNLFVCITSRPEQDIQTVLNPLTSASCRVALHEESGQREDIRHYVRSFVNTDRAMRRWKEEDKELVINMLSERASGIFHWAYCQLDALRQCFPSSIRKTLNELPTTLDAMYGRTIEAIPKQKRQHAHRLFQCLVAAIRPLRVDELGEIFAMELDQGTASNFMEGWRPENPEEAILSTCSTLISVIDEDEGRKIVQFSHFSVKEFLTSDRLGTSSVGNIRDFHIPLDVAHTILARACLTVLLQFDEKMDKKRLATFPLALYAAQHWFVHAKHEGVAPQVQDAMEQLFNPNKPYFAAWVWAYDVDVPSCDRNLNARVVPGHPSLPKATALYYAVLCGLCGPAKYLISTHGEDVNAKCGYFHISPLHVASRHGHLDAVSLLLDYGADVNITHKNKETPLCTAYDGRHLDVMRLLLERGAAVDVPYGLTGLLIHWASIEGRAEVIRLLLQHNADVNTAGASKLTPLYLASANGHVDIAQGLLEHGADVNFVSKYGTSLWGASCKGKLDVVRLLLEHGADVNIRVPGRRTPLEEARRFGYPKVAQLLLKNGAKE